MRKILIFVALLLLNLCGYAQIDPVRTELNSIFQNINKTQIPTGYLNEYGPEVVNKKWLTGALSDSNFLPLSMHLKTKLHPKKHKPRPGLLTSRPQSKFLFHLKKYFLYNFIPKFLPHPIFPLTLQNTQNNTAPIYATIGNHMIS